jgi:hypothetical protein
VRFTKPARGALEPAAVDPIVYSEAAEDLRRLLAP